MKIHLCEPKKLTYIVAVITIDCLYFSICSFPGLLPEDNVLDLLKMMSSKNPTIEIFSKFLLDGGYDLCKQLSENQTFWKNKSECDPGYITDSKTGYCYIVHSTFENFDDGENICVQQYDAELLAFDTNFELSGIIELFKTGNVTVIG